MQTLRVINLGLNEEIKFDMSGDILLSHIEGLGIPDVTSETTQSPLQDGSDIHGVLLGNRIIRLDTTIRAIDREKLYELRRKILRVINPRTYNVKSEKRGELLLFYTNDYKTYRIYAHIEDTIDFKERFGNNDKSQIIFTAHNPYLLDEENTKLIIKKFSGGLKFPLKLKTRFSNVGYKRDYENDSDTDIAVKIKYFGPVINPIITNETTGESIKVNRTLEEGDILEINTEDGKQTVNIIKEKGTTENVFHWIDLENRDFFKLIIGRNIISYSGDDESHSGNIELEFARKWVGA